MLPASHETGKVKSRKLVNSSRLALHHPDAFFESTQRGTSFDERTDDFETLATVKRDASAFHLGNLSLREVHNIPIDLGSSKLEIPSVSSTSAGGAADVTLGASDAGTIDFLRGMF